MGAINDIELEYTKATEWSLATLEELALLRSTSASRIERQISICEHMLTVCQLIGGAAKIRRRIELVLNEVERGATIEHVLRKTVEVLRS